ncbi:hypothetical protein [Candidatus Nitrosocosmicus arcticus]|uniref:hypothetical protein n=1 Tax=Candidatus Nitrosocosmicus arcticus TaxID=2035267 RepID=UPI0011A63EAD|nr:hypothetical protein [Candidatus Nitrosocosmicus arcticus]
MNGAFIIQMLRIRLNAYGLLNPFSLPRSTIIEQISLTDFNRAPLSTLGPNQLLQIVETTSVAGVSLD